MRRKKRGRWRYYWDVEASDPHRPWDGATLVCLLREDGERWAWHGPACLAHFVAFIEKNPGIYYAHYGGGYDVPLLLNYWRPERLVITGSIILCAEGRGGLSMRDTFPFWLASLAKVGQAVGIEKLDIDRAQIERLTAAELEAYCFRDVEVLRAGMLACRAFLESYNVDPNVVNTAGSAATSLMKSIEPLSYLSMMDQKIQTQTIGEMLAEGGNKGAMTMSYALGRRPRCYVYDIKSSYPARYAMRDVPIGLRRATANELAHPESFEGIARASFNWPHARRVPVAYDDLTGAGYGDVESWIVDDEIQILLREGIKVTLHEGWCGTTTAPIGQDFARELFAAKESGGPASFFSKVFVNSWHGKTGMDPVRDNYEARYPSKYWNPTRDPDWDPALVPNDKGWLWHFYTLGADKNGFAPWWNQPMISAIVLGRARAALWEINNAFQQAGWQVFYNDTDSVVSDCPRDRCPVPLGKDLGMLAFEGGPYEAIFLGAKAYIMIDENGLVAKCALKGVPHKSYRDAIWDGDIIREARGNERITGSGLYSRKGAGRDRRIELFERALASSAKAYKDGLTTFKRGLRDMDWKRASLTREIKPTIVNVAFDSEGWRLMSADEILAS